MTDNKKDEDHVFDSGGKRSSVKPYYAAIPYMSLRRLALRATGAPRGETLYDDETGFSYEGGSRKYGYHNWARGLPMEDTVNHVIEHLLKWKTMVRAGEIPGDDDLAAAAWGIMFPLMTFEYDYAMQAQQRMTLKDLPVEDIDREMVRLHGRRRGYLLQPLSPETVAPEPGPTVTDDKLEEVPSVPFPFPTCGNISPNGQYRCNRGSGHILDHETLDDTTGKTIASWPNMGFDYATHYDKIYREPAPVPPPVAPVVQSSGPEPDPTDPGRFYSSWFNCECVKALRHQPVPEGYIALNWPDHAALLTCVECRGMGVRKDHRR